ncbi:MAG: FdhF/YdeP family oxidoreductase [Bryobacteraceae bacterium]|nr:FdhF/YdeP family oxidoreductase [Bryobacteraceae bacterium]
MPTPKRPPEIVSLSPFGLGYQKPHHYWEMLGILWRNRDNLVYAWRVLNHGVCDGCSLGPRGLRDDTLEGTHLCLTRLRLLRLNTMPAAREEVFRDVAALKKRSSAELRDLGRLPFPMIRRPGEPGFTRVIWDEALRLIAERLRRADPKRVAFFTTSRGLTNEAYYAAAKLARLYGTNHIDNAARLCHAASTVALKETLGVGASTVSNKDWLNCELIVLSGSNLANNQPVAMKYLYEAKRNGARIVVVNPYREPGLERYWIPSIPRSALFGTRFRDDFYAVRPGGDVAFSNGVLKALIELNALDREFIASRTSGWENLKLTLDAQSWGSLEASSGLPRAEMEAFAKTYAAAKSAIFIWSMGLTQHPHGVDNVKSIVNLALARGMVGKPNCGVVPIRGHSGVQGGAECGSVPNLFPGNVPITEESARVFAERWGIESLPTWHGMHCGAMLEAALDVLYSVGGNFLETMPDPEAIRANLRLIPLRVHQDILLNASMLEDAAELTILLPSKTRYEQEGGGTQTSTERRLRYSPEITGHRIPEARAEWRILNDLGEALGLPMKLDNAEAIRAEMDRVMPMYRGIAQLKAEGDSFQYGGPLLCAQPDFVGRFSALSPPPERAGGKFFVASRRGTQFNSMILKETDALTGCARDEILMNPTDAMRLEIEEGDAVELRSPLGAMIARVALGDVKSGSIQAHWPECNGLIERLYDPASGEPDYNAEVTVRKLK